MKKSVKTLLVTVLSAAFMLGGVTAATAADVVKIDLTAMTADGKAITENSSVVNNGETVIYYESGHDSEYGESTDESEQHTATEAAAVEVVTITEPGTYEITGTLKNGQLAVDLGENAKDDPEAVVTLILNGCNIENNIAPAVIFYNVYECGPTEVANATAAEAVDTADAGARVIIADGSVNNITGSHVAKILKTDEHPKYKFDGAFYSKMTMSIDGGSNDTGVLNIVADNEGLDTEMHLSIDGGNINIESQNDGINTNEDGVSVTQINDGNLHIVAGLGSEGDGIDSNGYLVINGGIVIAHAKPTTDSGMDSDCGTLINGGTVVALGSAMDDASDESNQGVMNLKFSASQKADSSIVVKDTDGKVVFAYDLSKDTATGDKARSYSGAIVSAKGIESGETYHVYTGGEITGTNVNGLYTTDISHEGGTQLSYNGNIHSGAPGGMEFDKDGRPLQKPDGAPEIPNGPQADGKDGPPALPEGEQGAINGANGEPPALPEGDLGDTSQPTPPAGGKPGQGGSNLDSSTASYDFVMIDTATTFANVSTAVPGETTETAYKDVATDAWYYEAVQYVTAEKLMNGSGNGLFAPNDDITRGMIVTILWRMAGSPTVENDCAFTDLAQDWYKDAVKWAAACGIVKGYSDTQFAPDKSITREEMAAILYRYGEFKGEEMSADADLSRFKDAAKISDYAQDCMKWAVGSGLINGETADTLAPQGTATRAQAAQILMRYCQ